MFVEVENTGEGVMVSFSCPPGPLHTDSEIADGQTDLFPGLDAKQPKVVAGCITCLKEIIE